MTSNDEGKMRRNSGISLCMIVRDEEEFLPGCLASVRELVEEIVLVDTGSTDATIEIARRFDARIYEHPWENDYSLHRNQSLEYAKCRWILVLDADERIAPGDIPAIRRLVEQGRFDGFLFTLRNYERDIHLANITANPGDYREGKGFPCFIACDLIRLFRNDRRIRFEGHVHESVSASFERGALSSRRTGIPVHHYGKVRADRVDEKRDRYLQLGWKRIEQSPDDPVAYQGLAEQLLELGKATEALAVVQRGLDRFPGMIELRFNRGLALDRLDRQDEAQGDYAWVLERRPDHAGACHNLGRIHHAQGLHREAISIMERGKKAGLRHPALLCLLGRCHGAVGSWAEAMKNFDLALSVSPDFPDAHRFRAVVYLNLQRFDEAVTALEKEIACGGNLAAAYQILGEIALHRNDRGCAGECFRKVLAVAPHHPAALACLSALEKSLSA